MAREVPTAAYLLLCIALLAGNATVYRTVLAPPALRVSVLAAGEKGNAILVQGPDGETLLVNAGGDAGILRALGSALPFWQRRIDALVLTSVSVDTAGGAPAVLGRYRVGMLFRPRTEGSKAQEAALAAASAGKALTTSFAERGKRLALGGAYADVLWPPPTNSPLNAANGEVVLRVSWGTTAFLIQNLSPHAAAWLATLDAALPPPSVVLSSSTPAGAYASDGTGIVSFR